jgi:hypothetical protein
VTGAGAGSGDDSGHDQGRVDAGFRGSSRPWRMWLTPRRKSVAPTLKLFLI